MNEPDDLNPRDLIINLRGGVPSCCDFCGKLRPENEMHPEEGDMWACIHCIRRWEENDDQD